MNGNRSPPAETDDSNVKSPSRIKSLKNVFFNRNSIKKVKATENKDQTKSAPPVSNGNGVTNAQNGSTPYVAVPVLESNGKKVPEVTDNDTKKIETVPKKSPEIVVPLQKPPPPKVSKAPLSLPSAPEIKLCIEFDDDENNKETTIQIVPETPAKSSQQPNILEPNTCNSPMSLSLDRIQTPIPRGRSASRVWIDFLTEPGVQIKDLNKASSDDVETEESQDDDDGGSETSSLDSRTRKPKKVRIKQSVDERQTWFNNTTGEQVSSRHVDDLIFETFSSRDENGSEIILIGSFLSALEKTGLRPNDSRLSGLFDKLRKIHRDVEIRYPKMIHSMETLRLNRETFKILIQDDILLISKAFRQQFVIPDFQKFCLYIEEIYIKCKGIKSGKAASYIPQLARVDPNYWGVSICTIDGQRYSIGDTTIPFTIQSCSKSLTYAICLDELGEAGVHEYIGQEPSGRMFNEIVLDHSRKPHNPMVNAGAIVTCALLKQLVKPEMSLAEKFDYTYNYFKRLAGGEYIGFDNATFLSEREVADRNYALGFYMRENKCFPEGNKLKETLDFYFQICSMECNCESAAVIAATLANGGICPVSEEKILSPDSVRDVLALMHSCGMYDYSGQFAFKVGLPAKSGVSGIVMVIVPNVLGIAVWSPNLDSYGNSVRGVAFCQELVNVFNFHKYDDLKNVTHKLDPRKKNYETKGLNIVNLLFSAALGDIDSIRRHHLSGMDMNIGDYDGRTALHLAAAEGHKDCVKYLIHHCHLTRNPVDSWGHLPIDDAIRSGHTEVVKLLEDWLPRSASPEKENYG